MRRFGTIETTFWPRVRAQRAFCEAVRDAGRGIGSDKRTTLTSTGRVGVGIRGMQERLRQFGGTLELNSNDYGTVVMARLPVSRAAAAAASRKEVA
jgi:signal transduction histidine kinase